MLARQPLVEVEIQKFAAAHWSWLPAS